jgi:hypothetical protein
MSAFTPNQDSPMRNLALAAAVVLVLAACQEPTTSAPAAAPGSASSEAPAATSANTAPAAAYTVTQWGPQETTTGTAFNAQPDGNSGLWFKVEPALPAVAATGTFGGKPLQGVVAGADVVTATVPADYLASPGDYPIVLEVPSTGARIEVGTFKVKAN